MRKLFPALFALAIGTGVMAQTDDCTIQLKGIIIDSLDQSPLDHTQIALVGVKNFEVLTDKDGLFTISQLCPGNVELHISHLNCEHLHLHLSLVKDTFIRIFIRHIDQEFSGARVVARKSINDAPDRVDKSKIESNRSAGLGQIFQELSGVSLIKTGSSVAKPVVNGLHSNRVIVINNGIRQEGQNWGMEHAPEIDPFLATEVILLKGAQSLRYGADGIGGILLVNPASLFREKSGLWNGEFNLSGFSNGRGGVASFFLGNKISDKIPLYMRVQGTFKKAGNIRTPHYFLSNTGLEENNFSFNLGYGKGKWRTEMFYSQFNTRIGLFTGSQIGNISDLKLAMQRDRPNTINAFSYDLDRPYQKARHQLLKWKNNWYKDALNSFELVVSYQRNHREEYDVLRSGSAFQGPAFDYRIGTWMAEALWTRLDVLGYKIQTGVFALQQSNAYTGRYFIPGFYQNGLAQYLIAERKYHNKSIEFSIRHDTRWFDLYLWNNNQLTIDKNQYDGFSALLRVGFDISQYNKTGFNISSTWRPAAPNELYANGVHQGIAAIEIGDPNLKKERSYNFSIEHSTETKRLNFNCEILAKFINGYINLVPGKEPVLTIRGAFPSFYYQQQDALIYGMLINMRYAINKQWSLKLRGNLLNGQDLNSGLALNQMPPYDGKLELQYTYKKWQFNLNAGYVARQWRYTDSSDYLPPPEGYLLIGAEMSHEIDLSGFNMKWAISVNNLFDTAYREYLNRFRYYADAQGRNIQFRIQIPIKYQKK